MKQKIKYNLLLGVCLLVACALSAQEEMLTTVSGQVLDAVNKAPLAGVRIQAYNDYKYAAMSNEAGEFTLKIPEEVSSISLQLDGYALQQQAVNRKGGNWTILLYRDRFSTPYTQETNAAVAHSANDFELSSAVSVESEIQTHLGSDVRTVTRSGIPGMGAVLFMNGNNSLNINAQPLIVVDGVIQDQQYDRTMQHDGYYNNILASVNVNDIEKVTVLKNGTALYGAKGGNGVILIQTKRSTSMATKIDATVSAGVELLPTLPSMMNSSQYRYYVSELLGTTNSELTDFKFLKTDPNYYYYNQYHNETNWSDYAYQEAFSQNYGVSVQGGDAIADYNLSLGYTSADATLKCNSMNRFTLRFNTDIKLNDRFDTRFDASFTNLARNLRDEGAIADYSTTTPLAPGYLSLIKAPFLSPYQHDKNGHLSNFYADSDNYLREVLGEDASLANPLSLNKYGEGDNKNFFENSMINLAIHPQYHLNNHLTIRSLFSFTLYNTNETYFIPMTGVPTFTIAEVGKANNISSSLFAKQSSLYSDTQIHWNKRLNAHKLSVYGGFRYMDDSYSSNYQLGYDTGNDKTPNITTGLKFKELNGEEDKWRSLSYYGNIDYNYAEKYYLQASLTMESSSRFGSDTHEGLRIAKVCWGLFPSIQGAWVISSEDWFPAQNAGINYLKLNVGYEESGNDRVDYKSSRTFLTSSIFMTDITGTAIANIGNTSLQWETTRRMSAGLETSLLNNRLYLTLNGYHNVTDNLLTFSKLSSISGLKRYWCNDGSLQNNGFDFRFTAKLLNRENWAWELGAGIAHYKNKIIRLPGGESFTTSLYNAEVLTQIGSPVGLFYGYRAEGVYATSEEAAEAGLYITDETGKATYFKAGDVAFVDKDGNHELNEDDKQVIGDPNPDFFGNIQSTLTYKHFTLSALFNYSCGGDVYNYLRSQLESGSQFFNQSTALTNRWTHEGQVTDLPRAVYNDPMGNNRFSDRWIEDGSYLRLRSVTLGYRIPIQSTFVKGLGVWIQANNLFTLTNYLGSDPESSLGNSILTQGIDRGLLPQSRSLVAGIKLNL